MSQIDIKVLKQGFSSRKVITCCFFTMDGAYRNFSQYIGNLKRFLVLTDKLPDFEVRIYTDDTGKDIALEVSEGKPRVSVMHYDCPQFREGKGHKGTFGMFVRFLPMFEDLEVAWCSDIDLPDHYIDSKELNKLVRNNCDVYVSSLICYNMKPWGREYSIIAHKFITRVQFPKALLTRFLNMITDGKLKDTVDLINDYNQSSNTKKAISEIPYGMDELFLNTYIYNWISKKNLHVLVSMDYGSTRVLMNTLSKEHKDLIAKHYYYPTHQTFAKLKQLLERGEPSKLLGDEECYRKFLKVLPKLKNSFVVDSIIEGKNL